MPKIPLTPSSEQNLAKQTFSSLKALDFIIENKNQLQVTFAVLRKGDKELIEKCLKANIPVGSEEELLSMYDAGKIEADYLFSFYWKLVKEPTLKIARLLCTTLGITPAAMLGC